MYLRGYWIYYTLCIKTRVKTPIGNNFFVIINNEKYFLKKSQFGSLSEIVPCRDKVDSYTFVSNIKVIVNQDKHNKYQGISSGELISDFHN